MSPTSRVDEWMASDEPVLLRVSPIQNRSNKCSPKKEFSKSNSIDNLISSLEESSKPSAKLENGEVHRNGTSEHSDKLNGFRENDRLSPANDSNRQRKDSGDPICADFYCEIGTTIEMTSRNVELLNQKNAEKRELRIGADERSRSKFGSRSSSCSSASNSLSDKQQRLSPAEPASPRSPSQKSIISSLSSEVFFPRKTSSPSQTESFVSWESRLKSRSLSKGDRSSRCSNASSSSLGSSLSPLDSPTTCTPQSGVEELALVQRSEVVLRVNASTSDAASQTEVIAEEPMDRPPERKKLPEEIECEELSRDLASQLSPNDKLVPILVPIPERKKPEDYVSGLFWNDARPRTRRRLSLEDSLTASSENGSEEEKKIDSVPTSPLTPPPTNTCNPLSPTSPYFTISESRARFLTRYTHDMSDRNGTDGDNKHVTVDSLELRRKKEELVIRLDRKLVVLRAEQDAVREESELNEALGARVTNRVAAVARPMEASKYRLHVEEVGKITSLLLGLSGRLARAENALFGMSDDDPEKKILESKKDKLVEQLEEAKILKSNIDKRSVIVSNILSKYLNDEEFADYQHFINMKSKLLVEAREIQDKVKLGEEQLAALRERID